MADWAHLPSSAMHRAANANLIATAQNRVQGRGWRLKKQKEGCSIKKGRIWIPILRLDYLEAGQWQRLSAFYQKLPEKLGKAHCAKRSSGSDGEQEWPSGFYVVCREQQWGIQTREANCLGSNLSSAAWELRDLGHIIEPLCASVSFYVKWDSHNADFQEFWF